MQDLVLLQTVIGLSIAIGVVAGGSTINRVCQISYKKFNITRQHVCQVNIIFINDIFINKEINDEIINIITCIVISYPQQISVILISLSTLVLSAVSGYRGLCVIAWVYGVGLGGYRYSLKMLALERFRGKYFTKAWGE